MAHVRIIDIAVTKANLTKTIFLVFIYLFTYLYLVFIFIQ
jgi:hypothetical protein